jgi:hypothetical protein
LLRRQTGRNHTFWHAILKVGLGKGLRF